MAGGKPIAFWSQCISDVSAINPLVAFYDIHGRKREVLFFYFVKDTKREIKWEQLCDIILEISFVQMGRLVFD
jgi:hypothetical protein